MSLLVQQTEEKHRNFLKYNILHAVQELENESLFWSDLVTDGKDSFTSIDLPENLPDYEILDMKISVLSASFIFEKYGLFLALFPSMYKQEQKHCYGIWKHIFNYMQSFLNVRSFAFLQYSIVVRVFMQLMVLCRDSKELRYKLMLHLQQVFYNGDTLRCYKDCIEEMKLAHNTNSKIPCITMPFIHQYVLDEKEPELFPTAKLRIKFYEKMWQTILDNPFRILDINYFPVLMKSPLKLKWVNALSSFRRYVYFKIHNYMKYTIGNSAPLKPSMKSRLVLQSQAYEILLNKCICTPIEEGKFMKVHFVLNKPHSAILSEVDYEKILMQPTHHCTFVKHGSYMKYAHPWFHQQLEKFHGFVPKLKFQEHASDGILIADDVMKNWLPHVPFTGNHTNDITKFLNIHKTKKIRPKKCLFEMPFPSYSLLQPSQLKLIYEDYELLKASECEREVFYELFWNFPCLPMRCKPAVPIMNCIQKVVAHSPAYFLPFYNDRFHVNFSRFWDQVSLYMNIKPSQHLFMKAMHALATRDQPNAFPTLADNCSNVPFFMELLHIICKNNILLLPIHNMNLTLIHLLFSKGIPGCLKRLAWQSLTLCRFETNQNYPSSLYADFSTVIFPEIKISLPLTGAYEDSTIINFDRETGTISNIIEFRDLVDEEVMPDHFDIRILNEEGQGVSVYAEVLYTMWKNLIDRQVIVLYDPCGFAPGYDPCGFAPGYDPCGFTPGYEEGFCIASEHGAHRNELFALGLISGLCLSRGLHLPFPLYVGWWRQLFAPDNGIIMIPLSVLFTERFFTYMAMVEHMSNAELCTVLALEEKEVEFQTREELVTKKFLPSLMNLEIFKMGFDLFMQHIPMGHIAQEMNSIFVEPKKMQMNYENFCHCFEMNNGNIYDRIFLEYMQAMASSKGIEKIVQFITGKNRLPYIDLGEDKISVHWYQPTNNHFLPKAQNCTNKLMFPLRENTPVTIEEIHKIMSPIFDFPTVFGFL